MKMEHQYPEKPKRKEFAAPAIGKFLNNSWPRSLKKPNVETKSEQVENDEDDFLNTLNQLLKDTNMIFEPSEAMYKDITADIEEAPSIKPGEEFPLNFANLVPVPENSINKGGSLRNKSK